MPFVAFMTAPLIFRTARDRLVLAGVLAAAGAYLGLTALLETLRVYELVFPRYIGVEGIGIHFGRARGPFVEAGANGMALWACAVGAAIVAASVRELALRLVMVALSLFCVAGVFFTLTRAVWAGAVIAGFLSLMLLRELRRYLIPVALVGAVVVVGGLAVIPGLA